MDFKRNFNMIGKKSFFKSIKIKIKTSCMLQRYLLQYRKYFSISSKINKIEKNFKNACTYILQAYKDQEIHIATS